MNNILIGRPEGQGPIWRYKHKCADDIIIGCKEIGYKGMDWTD
jgi:hypothetical protein